MANNYNKKSENKKSENKYKILITTVLTILYVLLITKLSDVISSSYATEKLRLENYTLMILFLSIMGLIIAYFMIDKETNKGNYIIKNSLSIGGVIMLLYVMFFYWDFLGDYSKLTMIGLSILAIIYYIYN